jgi:glycosyltransferase involved in cell wall biosynthesis
MPRIKLAIGSIADFIDEILVADQQSKDGTREYCIRQGARVIDFPRDTVLNHGISYLRNNLIIKAKNDYVLILDSDEIVSPELRVKLCNLFKGQEYPACSAYRFYEYAFIMGKRIRGFDGYTFPRLLNKRHCKFVGSVHEKLTVEGNTCKLNAPLYHVPYESLIENREKAFLYGVLYSKDISPKRNSYLYQFKDISKDLAWSILKKHAWLDGRLYIFFATSMMKANIWAYYLSRKRSGN